MSQSPTLIGLQASLQRLEDSIAAARESINLEIQRIYASDYHAVTYCRQLARSKEQYQELVEEDFVFGQFTCMNGNAIREMRITLAGLKQSIKKEKENKKTAEKKISSIQEEIQVMKDEHNALKEIVESFQAAEAVLSPMEFEIVEGISLRDMMEMDEMMGLDNMDESVLDMEIE